MNQKPRVLFVEDNDIGRELLLRIFKRVDLFDVDVAKDGAEALLFFEANVYHVVLMDLQMPIMNGFEVTRHIRDKDQLTGRHTPIIAVTAFVGKEEQSRCIEAGMDEYMTKPFSTDNLLQKIKKYLAVDETQNNH